MTISAIHRRRARMASETIARRREGVRFVVGRAAVGVPMFASVLLHVAAPQVMAWASIPIPNWLRWSGALLGIVAVPMVYWVLHSLGHNVSETTLTKRDHVLITVGPYRWVRHPLYTTGIGLFAGIGLMNASWVILVLSAVTLYGVVTVIIPREEAQLLERFGDAYRLYVRRTGALVPQCLVQPGSRA